MPVKARISPCPALFTNRSTGQTDLTASCVAFQSLRSTLTVSTEGISSFNFSGIYTNRDEVYQIVEI